MSNYHEGCQLTLSEIAAVMSLAGKSTMVGFQSGDVESLSAEKIWSACCALMNDGMMTQIDGKFRLCRELVEVLQPMCQARTVLVLTPGSDLYAQVICYGADTVTTMVHTSYGRYLLTALGQEELAEELGDLAELSYPEQKPTEEDAAPAAPLLEDPREVLLQGARFLLEQLDPETGRRTGWVRVLEQGLFSWIQWTDKGKLCCEPLTKEGFDKLLLALLRGEK